MSVASKNPFAALLEDGSSEPAPAPASTKPAGSDAPAAAAPARGAQKGRGGPASRGGRYYQRGGKSAAPREGQNGEVAADEATGDAPRKRFDGEGRGRGRGGRGRGGERGRGRPFDKHSATGKTDTDKKVGQGWGHEEGEAELKAETAGETDAQVEAGATIDAGWGPDASSADAWGAPTEAAPSGDTPAEEKSEGRPRREREVEEEDNTVTLEEYLKQQKEKELELVPKLETRKANEGDDSIWKDAVVVGKKDEEEDAYFVGKTKNAPKTRAKKDEKVFLEIDARFERPQRGGRGGRGGDRGDRPRGGRGRGGRGRGANGYTGGPALDVSDQTAFPSLA
ncbi:hypothetical protein BC835DRAFT_1410187 [Cytidiella melzeri]|nr:hypothetical protein BC835DRAFT_1410187 [Cytidiella melzeri]